jgi:hypothetical protein
MTSIEDSRERKVRVCRPAFQDSHLLLPRYYSRSELIRQVLKLRWWDPDEPRVLDLAWSTIPETDLSELVVDDGIGLPDGLRVIFFLPSTSDTTIWILGVRKTAEEFTEHMKAIYVGRSKVVRERMNELE